MAVPILRALLQGRRAAADMLDAASPLQGVAQIRKALGIPQIVGGGPPLPIPEMPFQGAKGNELVQTIRIGGGGGDLTMLFDEDVDAIEGFSANRRFQMEADLLPWADDTPDFTQDELEEARKYVYEATQQALVGMPDEINVYRIGDLPSDQVKSFTIDPNYAFSQHLPWADRLGGKMTTYRVKKSAILGAPDAVIRPDIGELEVLINTDDVQPVGE